MSKCLKIFVTLLMLVSTGCSATLVNRCSPFAVNTCRHKKLVPGIDVALGSAALTASTIMNDKSVHDKEFKQNMLMITATAFAISAIMGYGEEAKCEEE
jgi:hypothetical protein